MPAERGPAGADSRTALRVVALLTSHNRRKQTLACLDALAEAAARASLQLTAILVDDGSEDGTAQSVAEGYPWVGVVRGSGDLFWNRGMHRAMAEALSRQDDVLLWVNDDTQVDPEGLVRLRDTASALAGKGHEGILVGATADRPGGTLTYGGLAALSRWRRFQFRRVWDAAEPVECEAMNGNLVWIPRRVAEVVGNLDPAYEHALGDLDYALRARRAGFRVWAAPGFAGYCARNPVAGTFQDTSLPLGVRWRKLVSRKGLPPASWWRFTRRFGGILAPAYFCWPYMRLLLGT